MGLSVKWPGTQLVRFALLSVPWETIPKSCFQHYYDWQQREERDILPDDPLPMTWE